MRLTAKVRKAGIEFGKRQNKGHCAIADAIAYANPDARYIKVTRDLIRFTDVATRIRYTYRTPKNAAKFIDAWDAGEPVGLITLKLDYEIDKKPQKSRPAARVLNPARQSRRTGPARSNSHRPLVKAK